MFFIIFVQSSAFQLTLNSVPSIFELLKKIRRSFVIYFNDIFGEGKGTSPRGYTRLISVILSF